MAVGQVDGQARSSVLVKTLAAVQLEAVHRI